MSSLTSEIGNVQAFHFCYFNVEIHLRYILRNICSRLGFGQERIENPPGSALSATSVPAVDVDHNLLQ